MVFLSCQADEGWSHSSTDVDEGVTTLQDANRFANTDTTAIAMSSICLVRRVTLMFS